MVQVVIISKEAVERLAVKLEQWRGTGQAVDMYEEFRLLTLQVIGKAILSLPPDECDKVGGGKGAVVVVVGRGGGIRVSEMAI